jgi:hypothetical protein
MSRLIRAAGPVVAVLFTAGVAPAATPQEINAAIAKGTAYLKQPTVNPASPALVGLALLECGVPFDDPALKSIAATVRDAAYAVNATYHVSLDLLFLDRYGDPNDVPLVQVLGARLAFGHTPIGGWTYNCLESVPEADVQYLRDRLKPVAGGSKLEPGRLHPDVAAYIKALASRPKRQEVSDDNSNTQFALIALWVSRKHGVPADPALDLVVERFLRYQQPTTGSWGYVGNAPDGGSPSMCCAGLLGLATGMARREERLMKIAEKKPDPLPMAKDPPMPKDPFFTPAAKPMPKAPPKRVPDQVDVAAARGLAYLGAVLGKSVQDGRGRLLLENAAHGTNDLYFFWSVERVGVVYGLDKIGGVDWYAAGAETLVRTQAADGSWSCGFGIDVGTAFGLLFLCKSNVVKDLSQKVQRTSTDAELRGGAGPGDPKTPAADPKPSAVEGPNPAANPMPRALLPIPVENESGRLAVELIGAKPADWTKKLEAMRDTRGGDYTQALVIAIPRLDGDRKKEAREALAERLTRMSPDTLRQMMKADDPELRRGAVLAAAMKDDKAHVPDLIDRVLDEDDLVVRAARAGLKSLSDGKDFGPAAGATRLEREAAAKNWRQWWAGQKK